MFFYLSKVKYFCYNGVIPYIKKLIKLKKNCKLTFFPELYLKYFTKIIMQTLLNNHPEELSLH